LHAPIRHAITVAQTQTGRRSRRIHHQYPVPFLAPSLALRGEEPNMPRRPRASKASRAQGLSSAPTPIPSGATTPCSSAFPSTYPSGDELDPGHSVTYIPIRRLTLQDFSPAEPRKPDVPARDLSKPFRFLDLPSELRVNIYEHHFAGADAVLDLNHENHRRIHKKLAILRTCRTVYAEASHFFYRSHAFRVFPTHAGRFFKTKRPLLARLKPHQRACITRLELRLGPGWSKPPSGWVVNDALGLRDCVNVRKLTVFVQLDPSASFLDGFRKAEGFYEAFSRRLLDNILRAMPFLEAVEFDAWESVRKGCPIMQNLLDVTLQHRRRISWGPERGWTDAGEAEGGAKAEEGTQTMPAAALVDGTAAKLVTVA